SDQNRLFVGRRPGAATDPFGLDKATEAKDAYTRLTDSISKHTAAMEADAATVGKSVQEQEEFRVQMELSDALVRSGKDINEDYPTSIALISERAGQAKLRLAQQTEILQKLNSASQQFGSALANSFADAVLEGKKLNDVMSSLLKTIARALITQSIT